MIEDRKFPLLGGVSRIGSVPWWVAEQAYMGYASKYGDSQSLERLAERGGFGIEEMDEFFPEWREKASLISRLQADNERLEGEIHALKAAFIWSKQVDNLTVKELREFLEVLQESKGAIP